MNDSVKDKVNNLSFLEEFNQLRKKLVKDFKSKGSCESTVNHKADWSLFPTWSTKFVTLTVIKQKGEDGMNQLISQLKSAQSYSDKVSILLQHGDINAMMKVYLTKALSTINNNELSPESAEKSLSQSRQFMKQGLEAFKSNQIKKALEFYDKGISCSPFPEAGDDQPSKSNLSLCLVKRSRLYQLIRKYPESWMDMKDAIDYMPYDKMADELTKLKVDLMLEIAAASGRQPKPGADMDFEPFDVTIRPENRTLHKTLEGLEVGTCLVKGRTIVTSKPIKINTTVIAESPYACWLQPTQYSSYCGHCLKPLEDRTFPCRQCTKVAYCSSNCSEEAWRTYHSIECHYLPVLRLLSIGHLALRTLLIAGINTALDYYRETEANTVVEVKGRKSFSNTFKDIHSLMGSIELFDDIKMVSCVCSATFMTLLVESMGLIKSDSIRLFGGLILKTICQIILNGLTITDDRCQSKDGLDCLVFGGSGGLEIGSGLYASASLLSHSCSPNCDRLFIGSKIIVNTKENICHGSEITITYGPTKGEKGFKKRQKFYRDNFYFTCVCETCKRKE